MQATRPLCLVMGTLLLSTGLAGANLITDFNSATGSPGWLHTTAASGFQFAGSGNFDDGLDFEDAHVGSQNKVVAVDVRAQLNEGRSGAAGDHAVAFVAEVQQGGDFWFGALKFNAGASSSTDPADMLLTASAKTRDGVNYRLSLTHDGGGSYQFNVVGNGQWQDIGGALSSATLEGTVDLSRSDLRVEVNTLNEFTWGGGAALLVDNIAFAPVPEPALLGGVAGAALLALRRRRH